MKRIKLFTLLAVCTMLIASCGGSSTSPSNNSAVQQDSVQKKQTKKVDLVESSSKFFVENIEDAIKCDDLSRINMELDGIENEKEIFNSLAESDKYVENCKQVIKKYEDRIKKLIDAEEDQEVKKEAQELLEKVLNM